MTENSIRRTTIVGTGTIGASWAAYSLARGLEMIASDPAPGVDFPFELLPAAFTGR